MSTEPSRVSRLLKGKGVRGAGCGVRGERWVVWGEVHDSLLGERPVLPCTALRRGGRAGLSLTLTQI